LNPTNSYNNPIQYTKPLISGYISKEKTFKETVPFQSIKGDGNILYLDNTYFRAFWLGTENYCGMLFSR
jgi:hypothetical protein